MVKKKGKSKRTTLKDKYKIERRVTETHRKQKKQAKRDAKSGVVRQNKSKKDPGIPNSWPFKQDLLKEIQRTREHQKQLEENQKQRRSEQLKALREHQAQGGTARTVKEMLEQANRDQVAFNTKQAHADHSEEGRSDGAVAPGQQSRRAYLRELKKVVDAADVILQVLDARDPMGSRINPTIEDAILSRSDKKMVLVLNKIDLIPREIVGGWLSTLRRSHPTIAIKASQHRSSDGDVDDGSAAMANATTPVGMEGLLQLLKNYARTGGTGGKSKTTIVVGVIGYPNVGKSSIINALKRSRAVGVSPRPGFTTSMQEVVLDRNVRLIDSPGVVFDDSSALLGNCIDAESIEDPIPAVEMLLKRCNHQSLLMTYNIPSFPNGDVMMFLAMVARSYGRVLKGGIPDKISAARAVLKDWNNGKIPFYTPPPKERAAPEVSSDAVIVSSFGKAFDLAKYDADVMNSLEEKDSMDFVQLEASKLDNGDQAFKDDADYFTSNANSDDESMDESDGDMDRKLPTRMAIADAEDFDFEEM